MRSSTLQHGCLGNMTTRTTVPTVVAEAEISTGIFYMYMYFSIKEDSSTLRLKSGARQSASFPDELENHSQPAK